jgi:alkylation response protein AidB-like acyl-CoA dehydrogenase
MLERVASTDSEDCVARARALAPVIAAAAARIEQERRIPDEIIAALHQARLFRMVIPRAHGGDEVQPALFLQAVEAIARADASTAWCVGQGSGCSMAAAYLKPEIAREIFGPADAVMASGPSGSNARAVVADGGFRVTGRWQFASGSRHATWFGGHCTVCEPDGTPRLDPQGRPVERTMLFPRAQVTTTDVWQVVGLKGTGSDDYAVDDLFVPADFAFTREAAADRRQTGPLYRFSIFNIFGIGFAGVALGIARATLDDFMALAQEKKPHASKLLLRDNAVVQSQVGLAEAKLGAARAYVLQTLRELWDSACAGENFSNHQRAMLRATTCYAIHQAKEVVDFAYHAAGATAIFERNPFERRFRDLHTVTQQGQAQFANFELVGQSLLGLTPVSRVF